MEEIVREVGKEKFSTPMEVPQDIFNDVAQVCKDELAQAMMNDDKAIRDKNVDEVSKKFTSNWMRSIPNKSSKFLRHSISCRKNSS